MLPKLIILRGNSGSGKSTVAKALQKRMGYGVAYIEQDYIRRILLRERDQPGNPNIELIALTVRFALDQGYHVILEGILYKKHHGDMLRTLLASHKGESYVYYFDIPLEETVNRHKAKPNAHEFGETELTNWYAPQDVLGVKDERIITKDSSFEQTLQRIVNDIAS